MDLQTDLQTDRQVWTYRQTDRQIVDLQTDLQTDRQTDRLGTYRRGRGHAGDEGCEGPLLAQWQLAASLCNTAAQHGSMLTRGALWRHSLVGYKQLVSWLVTQELEKKEAI